MTNIRLTSLTLHSTAGTSNIVGQDTVDTGTAAFPNTVDEFVVDHSRGTLATLEMPPSFSALMNKNGNSSWGHPTNNG